MGRVFQRNLFDKELFVRQWRRKTVELGKEHGHRGKSRHPLLHFHTRSDDDGDRDRVGRVAPVLLSTPTTPSSFSSVSCSPLAVVLW
jgi:hypothetical protein